MKKRSQIILLLPLISFLLYVAYLSVSGGDSHWNPIGRWTTFPVSTAGLPSREPSLVTIPPEAAPQSATGSPAVAASTSAMAATALPPPTTIPSRTLLATLPGPTQLTTDAEIADGIFRAARIIEALEAYSGNYGEYPADLEALVPGYLPEIPTTMTGQPFVVRVFAAGDVLVDEVYWLSFRVLQPDSSRCTYLKRLQYWDCGPSGP